MTYIKWSRITLPKPLVGYGIKNNVSFSRALWVQVVHKKYIAISRHHCRLDPQTKQEISKSHHDLEGNNLILSTDWRRLCLEGREWSRGPPRGISLGGGWYGTYYFA
jgi:hypothetical protein